MASDDDSSTILPFRPREEVPRRRSFRSDPRDLDTHLAAQFRRDGSVTLWQLMKGLQTAGAGELEVGKSGTYVRLVRHRKAKATPRRAK